MKDDQESQTPNNHEILFKLSNVICFDKEKLNSVYRIIVNDILELSKIDLPNLNEIIFTNGFDQPL